MIKKFFKKTNKNLQKGFSLLEMVMVLSIFGLITAIVTYNYGSFNNQMTLTNLAYEIAMQIREAQVYSLGVRSSNNSFQNHYGIYFRAGSGSFITFIDANKDGLCDSAAGCDACPKPPAVTECQNIFSLPRQMKIEDVKVTAGSALTSTNNPVFITFKRPDTEAIIKNGGGAALTSGQVEITIISPDSQRKKIVIKQNGYISVEK